MSTSKAVVACQNCGAQELGAVAFLGFLPPVNRFRPIGTPPEAEEWLPAQLLSCRRCELVQLGLIVDASILFPRDYPYTSSTTKILRENFAELSREVNDIAHLGSNDLVVDIGSNDGNLLTNFQPLCRILGVTPEDMGQIAVQRGVPTIQDYFSAGTAQSIVESNGPARIVTATNVFAHVDDVHAWTEAVLKLLPADGIFVTESHYLVSLIETLQYDTIYHEHLRYYSLKSLEQLLGQHGLQVFHVKEIGTHGGSIRVYSCREGANKVRDSVSSQREREARVIGHRDWEQRFARRVIDSKVALWTLLASIRNEAGRVFGIGAPSRAATLVNYVGLDRDAVECVVEIQGSKKIGGYLPGTLIPVVEEDRLFSDQPEYALILSWHIAPELRAKLRARGFKGRFIVPLPEPRIIE